MEHTPLSTWAAGLGSAHYLDQECLPHVVLDHGASGPDLHIHFAYFKWKEHEGLPLERRRRHSPYPAGRGIWLCCAA